MSIDKSLSQFPKFEFENLAGNEEQAAYEVRLKLCHLQNEWCKMLAPQMGLGKWYRGNYNLLDEDGPPAFPDLTYQKMMSDSDLSQEQFSIHSQMSSSGISSIVSSPERTRINHFSSFWSMSSSFNQNSNFSSLTSSALPHIFSTKDFTPFISQRPKTYNQCLECGKLYIKKYRLKIHMRKHKTIKCNYCHKHNNTEMKKNYARRLLPLKLRESDVYF